MLKKFLVCISILSLFGSTYAQSQTNKVNVSISKEGKIYWESEQINNNQLFIKAKEFQRLHKDPVVDLRADKDVSYGEVAKVISTLSSSGNYKVNFVMEKADIKNIVFELSVNEDGLVNSVEILSSDAGSDENKAALLYAKQLKFIPTILDGVFVKIKTKLNISYGEGSFSIDNLYARQRYISIQQLKILQAPNLDEFYPSFSRRAGEEGVVTLELLVNKEGKVDDVSIKHASNFDRLNRSAVRYAKQINFEPASVNGKPVDVLAPLNIKFNLLK